MDPQIKSISDESAVTYDLMAGHYDGFTGHHDYEVWLGALLPALEARGLSGNRLLDAGCGTGKSSIPMLERGWDVTACDHSAEMLERLREKVGGRIRTEHTDLRVMPVLGEYDLILCLGDVLNYCAVTGSLAPALSGLARNLAPGGLLLFDLNTVQTYRTFYAETIEVEVDGDLVRWTGQGDGTAGEGDHAESVMEITGGPDGPVRVVHRQRHVSREEALLGLAQAGLRCLDLFGQGFDAVLEKPLEEGRHTKAIYIAGVDTDTEEGR
ncbi:MAG: class I SAM-dependent methyltransferase [Solirubrobacterales bacterium]|nr:class I SAM-dependent methyltransferase [Solirubrobacterales bacterium]